ncbi:MAG: hypothetical protein OIF36_04615 [Alphaproteobacteria bacterium]|jgi:hypothetical protein|nr:hypothetical protein [Alphaproteobacteria bacterium]MCV6599739.1 hypothetical protein [Alphaproteobacteria bacterium]
MKLSVAIIMLILTSSCAINKNYGNRQAEITVEHLKPIEICANSKELEYNGIKNTLSEHISDWFSFVVRINNKCNSKLNFQIKKSAINKTKSHNFTIYEETLVAEIHLNDKKFNSSAEAKTSNKIKLSNNLTLKEKENFLMTLREKTLSNFDKNMKKAIKNYIMK